MGGIRRHFFHSPETILKPPSGGFLSSKKLFFGLFYRRYSVAQFNAINASKKK